MIEHHCDCKKDEKKKEQQKGRREKEKEKKKKKELSTPSSPTHTPLTPFFLLIFSPFSNSKSINVDLY